MTIQRIAKIAVGILGLVFCTIVSMSAASNGLRGAPDVAFALFVLLPVSIALIAGWSIDKIGTLGLFMFATLICAFMFIVVPVVIAAGIWSML